MKNRAIFRISPEGLFFGRRDLMERLYRVAVDPSRQDCAIILKGSRWIGKTEVLRRLHRDLFWNQGAVTPLYYQFRAGAPVSEFAGDFIKEVVKQFLAFMRRDPGIATSQITLKKLRLLLSDEGLTDAARLISAHLEAEAAGEVMALLRNALSVPGVLSRLTSSPAFLLLDDMDRAGGIRIYEGGPGILREIASALGGVGEELGGLIASAGANVTKQELASTVFSETIEVEGLAGHDARAMIEELARGYGLPADPQVVIVAARRLGGNPFYIREILRAASSTNTGALKTLKGFSALYVREITSGALGAALGGEFSLLGQSGLRVLKSVMRSKGPVGIDDLLEMLGVEVPEMERTVSVLESLDLVKVILGSLESVSDPVVRDYIEYMCSIGLLGKSPEETMTWMIRDVIKSGRSVASDYAKGRFMREVRATLEAFDGQDAPRFLFHVGAGGAASDKEAQGQSDEVLMALPSVTGCFSASAFEKYESGLPVVLAHGFAPGRFDASGETLWLVGVKGSETPVNTGDIDNFLRRSRILQREFRPVRVVRWLVGREGFTEEAVLRLQEEGGGVFTSDSGAIAALRKLSRPVEKERKEGDEPETREFEMVLPSTRNAELVGVRAAGEISSWMGFDKDSIGRIKTSMVEACINAFEHSGSPSAKVRLRFVAAPDMLTIYVSNPGLDFDGVVARSAEKGGKGALPHKRGWGLELMKGLMDEVRFESLDGGTRLVLVKYLKRKGEDDDGKRE